MKDVIRVIKIHPLSRLKYVRATLFLVKKQIWNRSVFQFFNTYIWLLSTKRHYDDTFVFILFYFLMFYSISQSRLELDNILKVITHTHTHTYMYMYMYIVCLPLESYWLFRWLILSVLLRKPVSLYHYWWLQIKLGKWNIFTLDTFYKFKVRASLFGLVDSDIFYSCLKFHAHYG